MGDPDRYGLTIDKGQGIFNGDMGVIREINPYQETITVEYDEHRQVTYPYSLADELELAYAITVHKAQRKRISGCGDPATERPQTVVSPEPSLYRCDPGKKMCHPCRKRGCFSGNDPEQPGSETQHQPCRADPGIPVIRRSAPFIWKDVKYEKNMELRGGDLRKAAAFLAALLWPEICRSAEKPAGRASARMPQSPGPAGHPGAPVYAVRQAGPFSGTGILPGLHGGPPFF